MIGCSGNLGGIRKSENFSNGDEKSYAN